MKYCVKCNEEIHPKRLEILPTTNKCVSCSTIQKKGVVTIMKGKGDHTWIETIHLEHDEHKKYRDAENKLRKQGNVILDDPETSGEIPFGFSETKLEKDAKK